MLLVRICKKYGAFLFLASMIIGNAEAGNPLNGVTKFNTGDVLIFSTGKSVYLGDRRWKNLTTGKLTIVNSDGNIIVQFVGDNIVNGNDPHAGMLPPSNSWRTGHSWVLSFKKYGPKIPQGNQGDASAR